MWTKNLSPIISRSEVTRMGNIAHMGQMRNLYKTVIGNLKRTNGIPNNRCQNNIKVKLK
jgi:hypothetical protein